MLLQLDFLNHKSCLTSNNTHCMLFECRAIRYKKLFTTLKLLQGKPKGTTTRLGLQRCIIRNLNQEKRSSEPQNCLDVSKWPRNQTDPSLKGLSPLDNTCKSLNISCSSPSIPPTASEHTKKPRRRPSQAQNLTHYRESRPAEPRPSLSLLP